MANITRSEFRTLDESLGMGSGYVLDFSDKTMREFFEDELGVDLDQAKYREVGTSKAKRLRAFLQLESGAQGARVLRALWKYREDMRERRQVDPDRPGLQSRFFE